MDHAICDIFKSGNYASPDEQKHLYHILEDVMNGTYKEDINKLRENLHVKDVAAKIKRNLPSFTPCGTFNGRRLISNIKSYNGIVPIDFDDINNEDKANYLKLLLSRDIFIAAAFVSPSFGVKAFMQTNIIDPKMHKYGFEECRNYIESKYSSFLNFKVDRSGKDISRLCFLSYDPTAFINTNAETIDVDVDAIRKLEEFVPLAPEKIKNAERNSTKILEFCIKGINASKVGRYGKGNRNNWVYALARSTNKFGIEEEVALHMIANRYSSLGYEETKATIHSAYSKNRQEFGSQQLQGRDNGQANIF